MHDRRWLAVFALFLTVAGCGSHRGSGAHGSGGRAGESVGGTGGVSANGSGGTSAGGSGATSADGSVGPSTGGGGGAGTDTGAAGGGIMASGGQGGSRTVAKCLVSRPFQAPFQVVPGTSMSSEEAGAVSADGLTALISSQANHNIFLYRLSIYTRSAVTEAFGNPQDPPDNVFSPGVREPRLTRDGLSLFFDDITPLGSTIWVASRLSSADVFGPIAKLPATINSPNTSNSGPWVNTDGSRLYFVRDHALYVSTVMGGQFGVPTAVTDLNAGGTVLDPVLTDDELTIYFASERQIGAPAPRYFRVVTSHRTSASAPWGTVSTVPELDNGDDMVPTDISPDGCFLYIVDTDRQSISRIKQAVKPSL